jgi:DNA-binding transcriptional regulator YiaG
MTGKEFATARWELRMTQRELARHLRVHFTTVNKWEKGVRPIPHVVEIALAWLTTQHEEASA